jgi:hypothetical protein
MEDFLERFRNNDLDVISMFGSYETFFKAIMRRGLIDEIDPKDCADSDEWIDYFYLFLLKNNKPLFYKMVGDIFSDVKIVNDTPMLLLDDRGTLADLFCEKYYRNSLSQSTIRNILSSESDYVEYFTTECNNLYDEVISNLNDKNIQRLCEYIVKELDGTNVEPKSDLLESIAEEQGHPEYAIITSENVLKVVDDESSMEHMLDILDDLRSDLCNLLDMSYNSAYENDLWKKIWNELQTYVIGNGEFVDTPHKTKNNVTIQYYEIPINDFDNTIENVLRDNARYGQNTLEYYGSYMTMINADDCLTIYPPDYPSDPEKYLNDYFNDYI